LPQELRRSLTWDQGAEMAQHAQLRIRARRKVVFCWSWAGFEVWPQAEDGE
jgi:IS30 family transposase